MESILQAISYYFSRPSMIFTIFWAIIGFIFFFGYPYIAKTFSYKQSEVTWNAPKERINYLVVP